MTKRDDLKHPKTPLDVEFKEFLSLRPEFPNRTLSTRVRERISHDLNPHALTVFAKVSLVHFTFAIFTLSICPQLGVRTFGEGMGLMHYFMGLGTYGCMAACGAFFLGTSLLGAALVLRPEEIRVLRSRREVGLGSLALLSVGVLALVGTESDPLLFAAWVVGAVLGAALILEAGWQLRVHALRV